MKVIEECSMSENQEETISDDPVDKQKSIDILDPITSLELTRDFRSRANSNVSTTSIDSAQSLISIASSTEEGFQEKPIDVTCPPLFLSQIRKGRRPRTMMTTMQLRVLMRVLNHTAFPSKSTRAELARILGVNERSIQVWFQNQRQRARAQLTQKQKEPEPGSSSEVIAGLVSLSTKNSIDANDTLTRRESFDAATRFLNFGNTLDKPPPPSTITTNHMNPSSAVLPHVHSYYSNPYYSPYSYGMIITPPQISNSTAEISPLLQAALGDTPRGLLPKGLPGLGLSTSGIARVVSQSLPLPSLPLQTTTTDYPLGYSYFPPYPYMTTQPPSYPMASFLPHFCASYGLAHQQPYHHSSPSSLTHHFAPLVKRPVNNRTRQVL